MNGTTDLNLLRAFVAVAETASFSKAAGRMDAPKSTVSRAVKKLEEELGVRLLHRTTRSVALSTAGEAFYERVAPRLRDLEGALVDLPEQDEEPTGELRVTASVDFGSVVLADVAAKFVARHPGVRIDMHLSNAFVDLVAEGFDLAFRISGKRLQDSSLHARRVAPLPLQLFASPGYLAKRGAPRTPADLDDHEWIEFGVSRAPLLLAGPGRTVKVQRRGRVRGDDMSFVREAVRAGAGVGMLPLFLVEHDVAAGALVRVLPKWTVAGGDLWIVHPGGARPPKKLVAFRDFAVDALAARGIRPA